MKQHELLTTVEAILEYLKPWTLDDANMRNNARAQHPAKAYAAIWFREQRGRLIITGAYPPNHYPPQDRRPRITVSATRAPKAIARDIQRRFLPDYLEAYSGSVRRCRAAQFNIATTNTQLEQLAEIVGETAQPTEYGRRGRLYLPDGKLEAHAVDSRRFHIELHGIDFETACAICEILTR
jgi:hypothetical protein